MSTKKEFVFTFAGNGSYSNRGCEAIVRGTTTLLRQQFGDSRYISNYFASDSCQDAVREFDPQIVHRPFVFPKRYSPAWFEEQFSHRVLGRPYNINHIARVFNQSLQESDAVLMLGGDNYSLDYRGVDIHFRLLELARDSKRPTVIWGASVGPFHSDTEYEKYASQILQQVSLICARETETIKYLTSIGVTDNVFLTADPAFYLPAREAPLPDHLRAILSERCMGINLSNLVARYIGSDQSSLESWQKTATEIVAHVVDRFSEPILLIPHVTSDPGGTPWRDDYLLLQSVAEALSHTNRVYVIPSGLDAGQTKWVIGQVALFAGARTHSTLAAMSSNVPTIYIGYSMKARGLAQDAFGHQDWLLDVRDLISYPSSLAEKLTELSRHEEPVRAQLERMNPVFRERASAAASQVADLVASHG